MGISIREFQVTMETFKARRLEDCLGSRYRKLVPCFQINEIQFYHSGSYYVVCGQNKISDNIMNSAMAEVGEKYPGGSNFWYGEVHSIKGMLVLATMLRGDYSRKLVDELTNEVYKKLLECSLLKTNLKFPFEFSTQSPKMEELRKLLEDYSNAINPFSNEELKIKEPIEYLDKVKMKLSVGKEGSSDAYLNLFWEGSSFEATFSIHSEGWTYSSSVPSKKNGKKGMLSIYHYYENGTNNTDVDNIVHLCYEAERQKEDDILTTYPEDIDLNISLKTGLAWKTYEESKAVPVTNKQIDIMISHLKKSIRILKKKLIRNIVNTDK